MGSLELPTYETKGPGAYCLEGQCNKPSEIQLPTFIVFIALNRGKMCKSFYLSLKHLDDRTKADRTTIHMGRCNGICGEMLGINILTSASPINHWNCLLHRFWEV